MPASFSIASSPYSYFVNVRTGIFDEMLDKLYKPHIITDEFFHPLFKYGEQPIFLEATEAAKSLDRMPALIEQLRAAGLKRGQEITAIGGGIIQDIVSFTTSIYMRGILWNYFPTTVLAMVDSCIGGKSSINVGPYKNLVGAFHSPQHIFIDPALAETLPRDQFASGLIEAAKITFVRGPESFARYLSCSPSIDMSTPALESVIMEGLTAKKHFIEIDEFDKKERLLLNFGHTFGHAFESASNYAIPHGIAVGLGILCSLAFQRDRGISFHGITAVAHLENHLDTLIRTFPGLSDRLVALNPGDIYSRMASDKKHNTRWWTLILVSPSGEVISEHMDPRGDIADRIRQAIASTIALFS
jgi:3-dehydroquinate synthase